MKAPEDGRQLVPIEHLTELEGELVAQRRRANRLGLSICLVLSVFALAAALNIRGNDVEIYDTGSNPKSSNKFTLYGTTSGGSQRAVTLQNVAISDSAYRLDITDGSSSHVSVLNSGNVGIGVASPLAKLHISDVLRLDPLSSAPSGATGDMYVSSATGLPYFYNGTAWKSLVKTVTGDPTGTETAEDPSAVSGTTFTAGTGGIFKNSDGAGSLNYTGAVVLASAGTGLGSQGGFLAFAGSKYFHFAGADASPRILITAPVDTTLATTMAFYLIEGNGRNGGNNPEDSDIFVVSYSNDGGTTWVTLWSYTPENTYDAWELKTITLPGGAKAASVKFRFSQTTTVGNYDHYGMDNLVINGGKYVP